MKIYTRVKVANHSGDALDLAKCYSRDFFSVTVGRPDVHKYALLRRESTGSYLIMVSDADTAPVEYTMIATVAGFNKQRTIELMDELTRGMGIEAREAPEFLKQQMASLAPFLDAMMKGL